jgi:hypothetical protein
MTDQTAPRITPEHIENTIVAVDYLQPVGTLTIALVSLENGTIVTGESACVSPENFDALIGRKIALENAKSKIWALEGYLLAQRLHEANPCNGVEE